MKALWFFENINLFNFLCPHKYSEFSANHTFLNYKKGDYIYSEDDKSDKVFLINSGKVKIGFINSDGDEIVSAFLSKGEIFGEKSIFDDLSRNEFAQAVEDNTSICAVSQTEMSEMLKNNSDFSLSIYKFIGYKFKKLERRIQILLYKDTKTRLKEFINELQDDFGVSKPNSNTVEIKHPYSQKEIALLIGTSRPTLNVIMNELKNENYLDFDRKLIILKKR